MKAVFDERQRLHDPQNFMANGVISRSPEQPARIAGCSAQPIPARCWRRGRCRCHLRRHGW